ncbi:MAG: CocE/NonD family hydrolase [Solirubrobacteraceae bacterium]
MSLLAGSRVAIDRDVSVEMRDGVKLAADVYLPDGEGPFPTLVYRVRGSRSSAFIAGLLMLNPLEAVGRGYAVAIQEVRGRAGSEARWHPFVHEREDGHDTLEWALAQDWCDGRLGTYGTAYSAQTALSLAALGREELKCVAVLGTGADYHDGWVYTNGAFELGWNVYWAYMTLAESIERLDVDEQRRADLRARYERALIEAPATAARLPISDHPLLADCEESQYAEWLEHPDYDEYWEQIDVLAAAGRIASPVLSIVGWHDNFLKSHMDLYRALSERAPEPARSHNRLVVGPWEHVNYVSPFSTSRTGAIEFGPRAASGVSRSGPMLLDWFDRWIGGRDAGPATGVRYWQLGANEWREAPRWPPAHQERSLYLHSGGGAATRAGDGRLLDDAPPAAQPPDSFVYDPLNPVPTIGGKTLMPTIMGAGIEDQSPLHDRTDVLCYTGPALRSPLAIAGPVKLRLWAVSSAPDTDFTAKLCDLAPDGFCANLAEGIVRARYRESTRIRSAPLAPGEPVLFEIDLWDLAHTFLPGHRVLLEVSSSNFPRFDRNMNTGNELGVDGAEQARLATQRILHDQQHQSALVLPIEVAG